MASYSNRIQFSFVPGRVRFSHLHCAEVCYGTNDRGHLQPSEFACVGCGRRIVMDEMLLSPGEGCPRFRIRSW